jgi:hypothetical protein
MDVLKEFLEQSLEILNQKDVWVLFSSFWRPIGKKDL